ncbi:MAG: alpha/beta hydrolase family protein, partial [Longimicrobiales bacterium]
GYWGFGPDAFPLNARVWYPAGAGPFPLVLAVHGNHDMRDFSDPGYAYLGELLASRGFILVSVDENFLNGRIRQENDARAWLLLKHLEAWRAFTSDVSNPLHGRADFDRIALIGHSRGGEAVAHAAAFNRLPRYPDDATVSFDFGFGIRAIIAIAPVDGQYRPADRLAPVRDVSYLVFHGSHDGDVSSFAGLRQYQRVSFTDRPGGSADQLPFFKAAVYVYRANHGQWNTVWGPNDAGPRSARILDLRGLLEPEEQRRFAEVYVSAFLESTLHDDPRYLPLFRDHRVAAGWLPKTMYITRFESAGFRPFATYQEDVDVTRGALAGVTLDGPGLATWREGLLQLRSANTPAEGTSQYNNAVWLGWDRAAPDVPAAASPPEPAAAPAYTITLPDTLAGAWRVDDETWLQFLLAPTDERPGEPDGSDGSDEETEERAADERDERDGRERVPLDLSIRAVDAAGESASVELRGYGVPREPLEVRILRRRDIEKREFGELHELVLQTYTIPLADFVERNPALDLSRLRTLALVFDRSPAGVVILDDVGFVRLHPGFTSL